VVSYVGMLGPQLARAVFGWDPGAQLKSEIVSEIVSEWNYNRKLCVKVEVIGWEIT